MLQTFQVGLRLVLLSKIRPASTGNIVESCLDSSLGWLAVTPAWKVSKLMSVCNYGWLILGSVWVLDIEDCSLYPTLPRVTALVILQSFLRILLMILYFKLVDPDTVLQSVDTSTPGLLSCHSGRLKMAASAVSSRMPLHEERQGNKID